MSETDGLVKNAANYERHVDHDHVPIPPRLRVAVLACMDSRLRIFGMLGLEEGDAHIIRNAGGIASEDAIRSLVISQRLLGTREIVVIHHTDCGMERFSDETIAAEIERETGVRPPFAFGSFRSAEEDVQRTVDQLRASPFIPHTENIRGFLFEVETGHLREMARPSKGLAS